MIASLLVLSLCSPLRAQEPDGGAYLEEWAVEGFPDSYEVVPDLNGDQVEDWLSYQPSRAATGEDRAGKLRAVDGRYGTRMWVIRGWQENQEFGSVRVVMDLDGDGDSEVLVGAPTTDEAGMDECGTVVALDGASGVELWRMNGDSPRLQWGWTLLPTDLDGDGNLEILIGNSDLGSSQRGVPSRIALTSTLDGSESWRFESIHPGQVVAKDVLLHDLNGDQILDVISGDPNADLDLNDEGAVLAVSGADGSLVWDSIGPWPYARLGEELELVDVDGDGTPEIASHSWGAGVPGTYGAGVIYLLDLNGNLLWFAGGSQGWSYFNWKHHWLDLDGDGVLDYLGANPGFSGGQYLTGLLQAWNGADGRFMWLRQGTQSLDSLGNEVFGVRLDPSGGMDILLPLPQHSVAGIADVGALIAVDGATGQDLWVIEGEHGLQSFPAQVVPMDVDGDGLDEIAIGDPMLKDGRGRIGLLGANGVFRWQISAQEPGTYMGGQLRWQDLDGDQLVELVASTGSKAEYQPSPGHLMVLDPVDGSLIWQVQGEAPRADIVQSFRFADLDNDGLPDVVLLGPDSKYKASGRVAAHRGFDGRALWTLHGRLPSGNLGRRMELVHGLESGRIQDVVLFSDTELVLHPGDDGGFMPFVRASADRVSWSAGGSIDLDLEFPAAMAFSIYQTLASAEGTGPTLRNGLSIPLSADPLFAMTFQGRYLGGVIQRPTGLLDGAAKGWVTLKLPPAKAPPSIIGRSVWFSVVSRDPWSSWQWASVAAPVLITP